MNFRFATSLPKEMGSAGCVILRGAFRPRPILYAYIYSILFFLAGVPNFPEWNLNAATTAGDRANQEEIFRTRQSTEQPKAQPSLESTEDWNRRLRERSVSADPMASAGQREYTIGPEDVLIRVASAGVNRPDLMQRAGHIGKIVVRPANHPTDYIQSSGKFPVDAMGIHVVIGGTSGFGLATAEWLADRGARHIALASRSGTLSNEAARKVEENDSLAINRLMRGRKGLNYARRGRCVSCQIPFKSQRSKLRAYRPETNPYPLGKPSR